MLGVAACASLRRQPRIKPMRLYLCLLWVFLGGRVFAASRIAVPDFPEESFRSRWDRGCEDWKLFLPEGENVALRFERSKGLYGLWGQARVTPERSETPSSFESSLKDTLSNSSTFLEWILPGINEHPRKGSSYFVELESLSLRSPGPGHVYLSGPYRFRVPGLKLGGTSTVELRWDDKPRLLCEEMSKSLGSFRVWRFRMFPRPDILEWMVGEMIVEAAGPASADRIIKIRLFMKPSGLVYRLLPEKLIEHELKFRAQRVLANFVDFRRTKVWRSDDVSRGGNLGETKAGTGVKGSRSKPARGAGSGAGKSPRNNVSAPANP